MRWRPRCTAAKLQDCAASPPMFLLDDCYDDDGLGNWNSFILPSLQVCKHFASS
jgi:hypothetical protein